MKRLLLPLLFIASASLAHPSTFRLAQELLAEESHDLSAVEFRRFAMESQEPSEQAASYLFASYAYLQNQSFAVAGEMLDRAEAADQTSAFGNEHTLLSAEAARLAHDPDTALYFYDLLSADSSNPAFQTAARRRSAALYFAQGNLSETELQLKKSPGDEAAALQALNAYASGKNKSPLIGGLLGLIPGAGYWYAGETANGFRSLILNSLFIYGMAQTADDEQWGAFAIITFFEITWYSGSIYGGIDSTQRHNQQRMQDVLNQIEGNLSYRPDPAVVTPLFKLNIHF